MRTLQGLAGLIVLAAMSVSCGSVVRNGRSPMFLSLDQLSGSRGAVSPGPFGNPLTSDVITNVTSPAPCTATAPCQVVFGDRGQAVLRSVTKDIGTPTSPTTPTTNNDIILNRYRVAYRRADGRNTPGVDVPYGFDGGITATVPAGGTVTVGFELVRVTAKEESPLVQLAANPAFISSFADVTFFGQDRVGNEINVTGSIQVDFGNFGDF